MILAREFQIEVAGWMLWLDWLAIIGLAALACFGILLTTWLLNRRHDPRRIKPPPDPP